MFWFIVGLILAIIIDYYLVKSHQYWTERNVAQGSLWFTLKDYVIVLLRKEDFKARLIRFYKKFENKRYFGMYLFGAPNLIFRDPELIKQIAVKDFDSFMNHNTFFPEHDELWSKNLFALKDQKWREMRSILSPVFTSSKIKQMFILMDEIARQFCNHFIEQDQKLITAEFKETFTRYTNDVIASTAFGIKCDSLKDKDNEFYQMGGKATNLKDFRKVALMTFLLLMPNLGKKLKLKFFSNDVANFFTNLVASNVEERERKGIVRPDLINLLIETKKGTLKHDEDGDHENGKAHKIDLTITDMTAQALIFFFAGFDSISSVLCFCAYELALNPDIQQRLIEEIDETSTDCDGKPSYETIMKMKYLDMVISETLRKWPANVTTDRVCSKTYTIDPKYPDERPVVIEKGVVTWIPIISLHYDEEYFPDPERFDPERFSDENKDKIKPYTYVPFGVGPRSCIGSRFALVEAKVIFFHLLSHFEIVPVENTQIPLKLNRFAFNLSAENGFWLGLKRREN